MGTLSLLPWSSFSQSPGEKTKTKKNKDVGFDFDIPAAPGSLPFLTPSYFLLGATPAFKPPSSSSATPTSGGPVETTFDAIKGVINEDVVKSTQGIYQFDLSGNKELKGQVQWACL